MRSYPPTHATFTVPLKNLTVALRPDPPVTLNEPPPLTLVTCNRWFDPTGPGRTLHATTTNT